MEATQDRLHSAESAATLLDVRPSTIRWWWSIGKLPRTKIGRLTRVWESEVLALIGRKQGDENAALVHVQAGAEAGSQAEVRVNR